MAIGERTLQQAREALEALREAKLTEPGWRRVADLVKRLDGALISGDEVGARAATDDLQIAVYPRRAAMDAGSVDPPPDFDRDLPNILITRIDETLTSSG